MDIPELQGVRKTTEGELIDGDKDLVEFAEMTYLADVRGNHEISALRVKACYNYKTEATTFACVRKDKIDNSRLDEICKINEEKAVFNSGGPVHITKAMEENAGANKITMHFTIGHIGAANDWFFAKDTECDPSLRNRERDQVWISIPPINNGQYAAECARLGGGNEGFLRLAGGEPTAFTCKFDVGEVSTDFETRVVVNMEYRYMQFIETPLLIKDQGDTDLE